MIRSAAGPRAGARRRGRRRRRRRRGRARAARRRCGPRAHRAMIASMRSTRLGDEAVALRSSRRPRRGRPAMNRSSVRSAISADRPVEGGEQRRRDRGRSMRVEAPRRRAARSPPSVSAGLERLEVAEREAGRAARGASTAAGSRRRRGRARRRRAGRARRRPRPRSVSRGGAVSPLDRHAAGFDGPRRDPTCRTAGRSRPTTSSSTSVGVTVPSAASLRRWACTDWRARGTSSSIRPT